MVQELLHRAAPHVLERQQGHGALQLLQELGALLSARGELLPCETDGLVDLVGPDELDEALLLEVEEELGIPVQDLQGWVVKGCRDR